MPLQIHLYTVVLASATAISAFVARGAWKRRVAPGAMPLFVLGVGAAVWAGAYALMWAGVSLRAQVFWLNAAYIGAAPLQTAFLVFALSVAQEERWLTPRTLLLLAIEPAITLLLAWTSSFHSWFNTSFQLWWVEGLAQLHWERGPWYGFHTAYSYLLALVAIYILVRALLRASPVYRVQLATVLVGLAIAWVVNIITVLFPHPNTSLDLTPIAVSLSNGVFAYTLFHQRLLRLLPVARGVLIERMTDGVLVLDPHNCIVDLNSAAARMLRLEIKKALGKQAEETLAHWKEIAPLFYDVYDARAEVWLPGDPPIDVDVSITPLYRRGNDPPGRLIVLRDITERKQSEADLRRVNRELEARLAEINVLQSQLREQAVRDPLTNLFNLRYLEETLEREIARASREGYPLCLLMMDLDHLKQVNDQYGHEAGNLVLKALAGELLRRIRKGDFACRFGGDEFVLVMPNVPRETALRRAEQLHEAIEKMRLRYAGAEIGITISVGVAVFPNHGETMRTLLRSSDQALYLAKAAGRNSVAVSGGRSRGKVIKKGTKAASGRPSSKKDSGRAPVGA